MKFGLFSKIGAVVLAMGLVLGLVACGDETPISTYTVNVTTEIAGFSFEGVKVCIYDTEMDLVQDSVITDGTATFRLSTDYYVATLSGLSQDYSYPSVLLSENTLEGNIAITQSIEGIDADTKGHFFFEFRVFVFEDGELAKEAVNGQICGLLSEDFDHSEEGGTDFYQCRPFAEVANGIGRQQVCVGNWDIALDSFDDEGYYVPKHFELRAVTEEMRFHVIIPNYQENPFLGL